MLINLMSCRCGCGSMKIGPKGWIFGHWTKTEKFRKDQSARLQGHVPAYVKKGRIPWNKGKVYLDPRKKKMAAFMRNSLRKCLDITGNKKDEKTFKTLGYNPEDLIKHIESLFTDGMCWENYGFYGWHVDHVRPISSFLLEDMDPKKVNALENLQPMWMKENLTKHAKWENHDAR